MKKILLILNLFVSSLALSQCACTWIDENGDMQCYLYLNCSNTNLFHCANRITSGTMCPCAIYPGSTPGCNPGCLPNGACWYNGSKCNATSICGIVLAAEIDGFDINSNCTDLRWRSSFEQGCDYYRIEGSQDLSNWYTLAEVECLGAGDYSISIKRPNVGVTYYRLVDYDVDGTRTENELVACEVSEKVVSKVYDMTGRLVELNCLKRGLYIFEYEDGSRIIKHLSNNKK